VRLIVISLLAAGASFNSLYDVPTSLCWRGDEPFLVIITIRHRNFTPENYKFNEGDGN